MKENFNNNTFFNEKENIPLILSKVKDLIKIESNYDFNYY